MELREIKFRAYADGKMFNNVGVVGNIIVLEYDSCEDDYGVDLELNYYGLNDDSIKLMQFTGLHDKNGKEIYEGDIIYFNIDNGVGIEHYQGIVKWANNNPYSRFEYIIEYLDGGFDSLSRASAYNDNLEVYGNIYENPELLKEEVK